MNTSSCKFKNLFLLLHFDLPFAFHYISLSRASTRRPIFFRIIRLSCLRIRCPESFVTPVLCVLLQRTRLVNASLCENLFPTYDLLRISVHYSFQTFCIPSLFMVLHFCSFHPKMSASLSDEDISVFNYRRHNSSWWIRKVRVFLRHLANVCCAESKKAVCKCKGSCSRRHEGIKGSKYMCNSLARALCTSPWAAEHNDHRQSCYANGKFVFKFTIRWRSLLQSHWVLF